MRNFFRCMQNRGDHESVEKVFIGSFRKIKYNTGLSIDENHHCKMNVFQKMKYALTSGVQSMDAHDAVVRHHCRSKEVSCFPVYQPSQHLIDIVKSYDCSGLQKEGYHLSGVNLCPHEKRTKPNETHVEFYFRSSKHISELIINFHIVFHQASVLPRADADKQMILSAASSTALISDILGKPFKRALKDLSQSYKVLEQLDESNYVANGFRRLSSPRNAVKRSGIKHVPAGPGFFGCVSSRGGCENAVICGSALKPLAYG